MFTTMGMTSLGVGSLGAGEMHVVINVVINVITITIVTKFIFIGRPDFKETPRKRQLREVGGSPRCGSKRFQGLRDAIVVASRGKHLKTF